MVLFWVVRVVQVANFAQACTASYGDCLPFVSLWGGDVQDHLHARLAALTVPDAPTPHRMAA
jgi:hypothetical protein